MTLGKLSSLNNSLLAVIEYVRERMLMGCAGTEEEEIGWPEVCHCVCFNVVNDTATEVNSNVFFFFLSRIIYTTLLYTRKCFEESASMMKTIEQKVVDRKHIN